MAGAARKSTQAEAFARLIPVLIVLFSLGYAVAAYAFLYIPKLGRLVPGGDLEPTPYNARLNEAQAYGAQLQKLQQSYNAVNADRRDRVTAMLPSGEDSQSLYAIFETLAQQNNMVLETITTSLDPKTMTDTGRQDVLVAANVAGGKYPQLKAFLTALEHEQRIIDVESVVFSPSSATYGLSVRAYVFSPNRLTTPPPPPVAPTTSDQASQ